MKFFDSMEPIFMSKLMIATGFNSEFVLLNLNLYQNLTRYIKIGNSYGKPFSASNGLGQGDSFSLMVALTLVSVQFDFLAAKYPNIKAGSCVDDRNIRGSVENIMMAYTDIAEFDRLTGHFNNPKKLAMSAVHKNCRKKLAKFNVGTHDNPIFPRIFLKETLVGDFINVTRAPARQLSERRITYTIQAANRVVRCPCGQSLRARAVATKVIPRMLQGVQWTFPAMASLHKLRSIILSAIWSTTRLMRCPEIITAILADPTKIDPWVATIVKIILNIKRIISKSDERHFQFIQTVKFAQDSSSSKIQGPAHTFVTMLKLLDLDLDLNEQSDTGNQATIWISDIFRARVDLLGDTKTSIKNKLRTWCRRAILRTLSLRCNPKLEDDTVNPIYVESKARKDMADINCYVDRAATLKNLSCKKRISPIC